MNNNPQINHCETDEFDESDLGITLGSGNVFADIGLPDPEVLQLKSGLIFEIRRLIEQRGLTPAEAAKVTGMSQRNLAKLIRGRYFEVTTEKLFDMLNRLGCNVEVRVTAPVLKKSRGRAAQPAPASGHIVLAA